VYVLTGNNSNEDAYFKGFMDKLEDKPEVAEELGIIKFTYVRLQGINPIKLSGLHLKKKKTMLYLGNVGLIKLFNI
jgi:hypothetical protein